MTLTLRRRASVWDLPAQDRCGDPASGESSTDYTVVWKCQLRRTEHTRIRSDRFDRYDSRNGGLNLIGTPDVRSGHALIDRPRVNDLLDRLFDPDLHVWRRHARGGDGSCC